METQTSKDPAIKLSIDSFTTRQFNQFSAIILLLVGTVFLLATNAPPVFLYKTQPPAECIQSAYDTLHYETCAAYDPTNHPILNILVDDIASANKFLILEISPLRVKSSERTSVSVPVEISAFLIQGGTIQSPLFSKMEKDFVFDCSSSQSVPCNSKQLINFPNIEDKNYYFVVKFLQFTDVVSDIQITSITQDLTFRYYLFGVKLFFFVATIACYFWHSMKMKNLRKEFFTREQRTFKLVIPLLIVINEPFTRLVCSSSLYYWIYTTIYVIFSAILIWFWMSTVHDMGGSESSLIEKSSKFVKIFTIAYGFIAIITHFILANISIDDHSFDFDSTENSGFSFFKYLFYIALVVALAWIGYKTTRIIRRMEDLTDRESTFFWFSVFFMLCHFYLLFRGALYPFSYDHSSLIIFAGISTIYVFASSFLYLPTKEGLAQAEHIKKYDNPDAKAGYKDLEESVVHPPQKAATDQIAKDLIASPKVGSRDNIITLEKDEQEHEQKYPYEQHKDEEI